MEIERVANDLVMPLWRGIASTYKSQYARNIWDQFESNIKSAAYTSRLSTFLDAIARKLSIQIRSADVAVVDSIIRSGEDRAVLRMLRDETTTLVIIARVANEERKQEYKESQESITSDMFNTEALF